MGAADDIRAGKLAKYQALQDAGLNTSQVIFSVLENIEGADAVLGVKGLKTEIRYQITPNPEVTLKRRSHVSQSGSVIHSDAVMIGAFPVRIEGFEYIDGEATGVRINSPVESPKAFRELLESAEFFLVDGEKYLFFTAPGDQSGFAEVDKYQSEWRIKLVRDAKQ
jgi:hypothetical protein